jgi:hypothetical protein
MQPTADSDRQAPAVATAILIFSTLSLIAAVTSDGFLEADGCTHYLYARYALLEPHYFVNVWGRPFWTALYCIPGYFGGRLGVRVMSLAVAISIALVAWQIAKKQNWRWPVLAMIFTFAQPLFFLHSFSELTELPFALLLGLAFWAYQSKQFFWMAVIIAVTPLSRPEGFAFLGLAAFALLLHRRRWWLILLPIPLLLWNYAGWRVYGRPGNWWQWQYPWLVWLKANWPYAQESLYQPGPIWHFVVLLPVVVSPLIFPATILGTVFCLTDRTIATDDHRRRCERLIALIPLAILFGHSVLYFLGKMASNGELRYMLVVAPFWGLLAARGWGTIFQWLQWRHALRWAAVASLLPILANLFYPVVPLRSQPDWIEAAEIAKWYHTDRPAGYLFLATAHPGIFYYLDMSSTDRSRIREWKKSVIDTVPPGTLLIWDPIYGVYNSDTQRSIKVDELLNDGWKPIATPWSGPSTAGKWQVFESAPLP